MNNKRENISAVNNSSSSTSSTGWFGRRVREVYTEPVRIAMIAFVTGLLVGTAAFLLKRMVAWVSQLFTGALSGDHANWVLILIPVVGVVLAAMFQRYVTRYEIYHGVSRLNRDFKAGKYCLRTSLTFTPMIAAAITLGCGGSAGSEGPIAYTGAAIGSNMGKAWHLSPRLLKIMVACGAGAGIAGIFKAPVGGAFFALECLAVDLGAGAVIPLMVAAVTAGLTAFVLSGCTPDLDFAAVLHFDMHLLPWVVALALFCGVYSIYYQMIMTRMSAWYASLSNHWVKNLTAGLLIGLAVFMFPPLFGEGYSFMAKLLAGDVAALFAYGPFAGVHITAVVVILVLAAMALVKAFATSSTTSGGGVAGDFAPSLFAGCVAGYLFAVVVNTCAGAELLPQGYFAFLGMGAVMAATQRAPLMAIFLTVEMAMAWELLLPAAVCAAVSYFTLRLLGTRYMCAPRS